MEYIPKDIHRLFRFAIPGYLFLLVIYFFKFAFFVKIQAVKLWFRGSPTSFVLFFLIFGFILGIIFFTLFHFGYLFCRGNHFRYIINLSEKIPCWKARAQNDLSLYKNDDLKTGRGRISFLSSKFFMCGGIFISQLIILVLVIVDITFGNSKLDGYDITGIFLSVVFIIYAVWEGLHNYFLVREFNKNILGKGMERVKNIRKKEGLLKIRYDFEKTVFFTVMIILLTASLAVSHHTGLLAWFLELLIVVCIIALFIFLFRLIGTMMELKDIYE